MSDRKDIKRNSGSQDTKAKQQSSVPRTGSKRRTLRRSRSSDGEREGRRVERRRNREEGRERGRSEERHGETGQRNSQTPEEFTEDTECMVCFCPYDNVFKAPKILACGHTFCLECLARINVSSPELKFVSCPVCRGLTNLPHGRDLPQLKNNKDIFKNMPPEMQRALSVRFKRSEGKLILKNPPTKAPGSSTKTSLVLPSFKKKEQARQQAQEGDPHLGSVELGITPNTIINVGRPPSRVRGRMRQVFRSNQCYYVVVAAIIIVTVALMLVGILTFVVIPSFGKSYVAGNIKTTLKPEEEYSPL